MACDFSIPFTGNAEAVLAKARGAVQSQGGTFTGDTNSGDFHVSVFGNKIVGNYTVSGQTLIVNITDRTISATVEGRPIEWSGYETRWITTQWTSSQISPACHSGPAVSTHSRPAA